MGRNGVVPTLSKLWLRHCAPAICLLNILANSTPLHGAFLDGEIKRSRTRPRKHCGLGHVFAFKLSQNGTVNIFFTSHLPGHVPPAHTPCEIGEGAISCWLQACSCSYSCKHQTALTLFYGKIYGCPY